MCPRLAVSTELSSPSACSRQSPPPSRPSASSIHVVLRSSPCVGSNTPAAQTTVSAVALPRDRCRYRSPNWRRPRPCWPWPALPPASPLSPSVPRPTASSQGFPSSPIPSLARVPHPLPIRPMRPGVLPGPGRKCHPCGLHLFSKSSRFRAHCHRLHRSASLTVSSSDPF